MARPTKYNDEVFEKAMIAYKYGATDKQVAEDIKVCEDTIHNWKKKHPKFFESLKEQKRFADGDVEEALFKRAKGYEKEVIKDNGNLEEKHYPPDTTACIYWLKNRQPDKWTDRTQQEVTQTVTMPDELLDRPERITREQWLLEHKKTTKE